MRRRRPRLGVVKFASCDGCQLTLLDLEDELLALTERFEIVEFAEATTQPLARPVRRPARRGLDQHAGAGRGDRPPAPPDDDARDDRRLRDGRRHPGAPQPGRPRRVPQPRSTRIPSSSTALATATPISDYVAVDAELRGCPIDPGQLRRAADGAARRPAAAAARRGRLPRMQARGTRASSCAGGDRLPRAGHADRLRRALPGLRPRLLRLLRSTRAGQRRGLARGLRPSRPGAGRRRPPVRRVHRLRRAVPPT